MSRFEVIAYAAVLILLVVALLAPHEFGQRQSVVWKAAIKA
jgi:hypothetical protein